VHNNKMPFGKYKGTRVSDLPDSYLEWLLALDDLREPLKSAVESEYRVRFSRRRYEYEKPQLPKTLPGPARDTAIELITVGYRSLSRKHHPDAGGDHEKMLLVNQAADWLREAVGC
jgi:hypothetical protein